MRVVEIRTSGKENCGTVIGEVPLKVEYRGNERNK